jgi:uncharacterized membrane protein
MKTSVFSRTLIVAVGALALAGCSNLDETQQRMLSGGAIGAAAGAGVTIVTGGCIACGTVIGAAVGTAGGYIVDHLDQSTKNNGGPAPISYQSSGNTNPNNYSSGGGYTNVNPPSNVYSSGN